MKKKMLAVFICLVMVAGLIPTVAFAAENEVDVWDGTSDTSWYNETDTEFHIKTAEQLAGLADSQILELILVHLQVIHLRIRLYI